MSGSSFTVSGVNPSSASSRIISGSVTPIALAELAQLPLGLRPLSHLLNELAILLLKVFFFVRALATGQEILRHDTSALGKSP